MSNFNLTESYISGLMQRLSEGDKQELSYASGATDNQIADLLKKYPNCPDALLTFLRRIKWDLLPTIWGS